MKLFNSIGHAFAWVLHSFLPKAEAVATDVVQVAESPLGTAIAGLLGSKGTTAQRAVEAIAGDVLKSFEAAGATISAGGLNVQFDTVTVTAIEQLYGDVSGLFGKAPAASAAVPAS